MFNRFGIRTKLMLAFSSSALILAIVGSLSYLKLVETLKAYEHVVDVDFPKYVSLSKIVESGHRLKSIVSHVEGKTLYAQDLKATEEELQASIAAIDAARKEYLSISFVRGEEQLWTVANERIKSCIEQVRKVLELSRTNSVEDLKRRDAAADHYETLRLSYREAIDKLEDFQSKEATAWENLAEATAARGKSTILILVGMGIVFSLLTGYVLSLALSQTMTRISQQLAHGADEVASASTEISSTAEQLSSSSVEQASAIQETASSIEEMSSMVRKNAENAKRSADTARDGQEAAQTGKVVIVDMLKAMSEIDAATREIADVVKLISQIESKTKVIDDIVFKTQLLSFNASVEAARAGEHGKGFAVVAEEVGNLAQMSGKAAQEISEMLSQSIDRVDRMITTSKQKVEIGLAVGRRCGEVLDEIVEKVTEINEMANDIAGASDEQARGVAEINKAMTQMDQMTQQNASAAQQSASSSEQLSQQAESMRDSVSSLLQLLNGSRNVQLAAQVNHARPVAVHPHKRHPSHTVHHGGRPKAQHSSHTPSSDHAGFDDAA